MTPISVRNIPSANSAVHEGISILLPDVIQIYFNPSMEECVLRFLSKEEVAIVLSRISMNLICN